MFQACTPYPVPPGLKKNMGAMLLLLPTSRPSGAKAVISLNSTALTGGVPPVEKIFEISNMQWRDTNIKKAFELQILEGYLHSMFKLFYG
jgi:hypothetical protein